MKTRGWVLAYSLWPAVVAGGVSACSAGQTQSATPGGEILIKGVPHIEQRRDFCGEACVAMVLQKLGHKVTQDHVFGLAGVDPALGRGCVTREMVGVLKRIGFTPGGVWHKIDAIRADEQIDAQWQGLLAELRRGVPSIVCMRYDDKPGAAEHFRLVLGYDPTSDAVIYHEPAERRGGHRRMKRSMFLDLWPLKYSKDEWLIVRMTLRAGRLDTGKPETGFSRAAFAQHVMALRPRVPAGFTLVVQPPFVVIGDEKPATVKIRAERTVKWFVDRVRKMYFPKDPPKIYDVWLFRNAASYRKHTKLIFNDEPDTPFGYCSADGALIMNIATGGGTLCHEIVHAFVASNFPKCPAWFNEGLASLYEQCGGRDDRVVGLTNWRLAGLKRQISDGTLPSFKTLISTTTRQFYTMDRGDNYAQARYLCYYLQQHGLLEAYYTAFRDGVEKDPPGYRTLTKTLSIRTEDEMAAFQKRWETWVTGLRFP